MLQSELIRKQEELNLKKYNQSFLAHCDMSGKMDFCKGCLFRTDLPSCAMDHETRHKFTVCARNFFRLEEVNHVVREPFDVPKQRGRTQQKDKKKSSVL